MAHYEYDPFGRSTTSTGTLATSFAHRFSTKPVDGPTGLYYYGYRHYDPAMGRWPSRDPLEENGGANLYALGSNAPLGSIDLFGLAVVSSELNYSRYNAFNRLSLPRTFRGHESWRSRDGSLLANPAGWRTKLAFNASYQANSNDGLVFDIHYPQQITFNLTSAGGLKDSMFIGGTAIADEYYKKPGSQPSLSNMIRRMEVKGNPEYCVECIIVSGLFDVTTEKDRYPIVRNLSDLAVAALIPGEGLVDQVGTTIFKYAKNDLLRSMFMDTAKYSIGLSLIVCADGAHAAGIYGLPNVTSEDAGLFKQAPAGQEVDVEGYNVQYQYHNSVKVGGSTTAGTVQLLPPSVNAYEEGFVQ